MIVASTVSCAATANAADGNGGFYIGAFGGVASTGGQAVEQTGTAHKGFSHEGEYYTYDLTVDVTGKAARKTGAVLGGQIGYEFATSSAVKPAIEVEGIFLSAKQRADLANAQDEGVINVGVIADGVKSAVTDADTLAMVREHVLSTPLTAGEHRFANTATANVALFTLNAVLSYETGSKFVPYVGAGAGIAFTNLRNAESLQTAPGGVEYGTETVGGASVPVNHFNSRTHASDSAFAVQAKAGLRYKLCGRAQLFAEYRLAHVASTSFGFGSTVYATHAPTDNWVVRNASSSMHVGTIGVRLGF